MEFYNEKLQLKPGQELHNGGYCILDTLGQGEFCIKYLAAVSSDGGKATSVPETDEERHVVIVEFFMPEICACVSDNSLVVCRDDAKFEEYRKKLLRLFHYLSVLCEKPIVLPGKHCYRIKIVNSFEENETTYIVIDSNSSIEFNSWMNAPLYLSENESVNVINEYAKENKESANIHEHRFVRHLAAMLHQMLTGIELYLCDTTFPSDKNQIEFNLLRELNVSDSTIDAICKAVSCGSYSIIDFLGDLPEVVPFIETNDYLYIKAENTNNRHILEELDERKYVPASMSIGFYEENFIIGNPDYDPDNSIAYYYGAAQQGDSYAQYEIGNDYHCDKKYSEAFEWFMKSALQGHTLSQFKVANMYDKGQGVEEDEAKAIKWYRRAVEVGVGEAAEKLADLCLNKDVKEAVKWYKQAATRGTCDAGYKLGEIYWNGLGVEKNKKEGIKWYKLAAKNGSYLAQIKLGDIYFLGRDLKQYAQAIEWYEIAATKECESEKEISARTRLGMIFQYGIGVKRNTQKVFHLYQSALRDKDSEVIRQIYKKLKFKLRIKEIFWGIINVIWWIIKIVS